MLHKNSFGFEQTTVVMNDSVTRGRLLRNRWGNSSSSSMMTMYIANITKWFRISVFYGLALRDVDMKNKILNIDH